MIENKLKKVITTLLKLNTEEEMLNFLFGILTPKEIEEISIRFEIVEKLLKGEAQHKIAEELGIGVATVSRGSKALQEGYFKALRK